VGLVCGEADGGSGAADGRAVSAPPRRRTDDPGLSGRVQGGQIGIALSHREDRNRFGKAA
jgi:hypothetical protein